MRKFYIILLVFFVVGCTADRTRARLEAVDSLLTKEKFESALILLDSMKSGDLAGEGNLAYYNLLKTQTFYSLEKPIPDDSLIDQSIRYYETSSDKDNLARAYYYKGELLYVRGEKREGVIFTKKAELLADKSNVVLLNHIYTSLAYSNMMIREDELSLYYAKKALKCAVQLNNVDWELYALSLMSQNYEFLQCEDSAALCVNRCLSLMGKAGDSWQRYVLSDLARFFQTRDPQKAERFINEAIRIKPNAIAYAVQAALRYNKDNDAEVDPILEKAYGIASDRQKVTVLEVWRDYKRAEKQYEKADELSTKLRILEDSIRNEDKRQRLIEAQVKFDNGVKEENVKTALHRAVLLIIVLFVIIVVAVFFFVKWFRKFQLQRERDRCSMAQIERQISELKTKADNSAKLRTEKEKEIKRLQKELAFLKKNNSKMLIEGRKRYLSVLNGGTTGLWKKEDYRMFVAYYEIVDEEFAKMLEQKYYSLNDRNKVILILLNMNFSIERIAGIMSVTSSAVRTALSRMRKYVKVS